MLRDSLSLRCVALWRKDGDLNKTGVQLGRYDESMSITQKPQKEKMGRSEYVFPGSLTSKPTLQTISHTAMLMREES